MLRADARQLGLRTGGAAARAPLVEVFAGFDAIVSPSGSCVAMVREQYAALARQAGDPELLAAVVALGPRVFELTQFLVQQLGVEDVGARFERRVTYHPACHLPARARHRRRAAAAAAQRGWHRAGRAARRADVLRVRWHFRRQERGHVGGDAGRQAEGRRRTRAEVVCSADNSCLLHVGGGLSRAGRPVRAMHVAEILASR